MTKIVELKQQLVNDWRTLHGDFPKNQKKDAYKNIIILTNKIRETDKEFTLDNRALEKYKEFETDYVPQLNRKVKWAKYDPNLSETDENLENEYNHFVQTALEIVSKRHPDLDTDSDKFGTIVNATVANLIAMSKH